MKARKISSLIMTGAVILGLLTGCGSDADSSKTDGAKTESMNQESQDEGQNTPDAENAGETETEETAEGSGVQSSGSNILTAYFSVPEDIDTDGIDADAGASVVVKDGDVMGNVQYMAQTIQQAVGGDLFRIETAEQYPLDHDPLVDQAADEQDDDIRPELSSHIENPEQYDTILLGYPNWWGDMPQVLYSFFDEYDFSGKTIIPFNVHNGSRFSGTIQTIQDLEPDASVITDGFTISERDVPDAAEEVSDWLAGLNIKK